MDYNERRRLAKNLQKLDNLDHLVMRVGLGIILARRFVHRLNNRIANVDLLVLLYRVKDKHPLAHWLHWTAAPKITTRRSAVEATVIGGVIIFPILLLMS